MAAPITAASGSASIAEATRGAIGQDKLTTDHFLQLLVTQLQHQDPLNPMSNEDFLAQLAQFQGLQEQIETASNTKSLLLAQSLGAASGMVGKYVVALHDGARLDGVVDKVVVTEGKVNLVIDGVEVGLDEVEEVKEEAE